MSVHVHQRPTPHVDFTLGAEKEPKRTTLISQYKRNPQLNVSYKLEEHGKRAQDWARIRHSLDVFALAELNDPRTYADITSKLSKFVSDLEPIWAAVSGRSYSPPDSPIHDEGIQTTTYPAPHSAADLPMSDADCAVFEEPPISDGLFQQVRGIRGLPERNMEDVVKQFLVELGHPQSSIQFRVGHMDLRLIDQDGRPFAVFEVKRSLEKDKGRKKARRQAFDYAMESGARFVVLTDGDVYEIYDRELPGDYAATRCGRFQLTRLRKGDAQIIDLLRP